MRYLVVSAHPLQDSLCAALTHHATSTLARLGHDVTVEDLYAQEFDPVLDARERASYYTTFDSSGVREEVRRLRAAEGMVLVFPTWWFSFPAILKGWFDRVWGPGIAYDHASDLGPIRPRLDGLKHVVAITTLGAPWWVDRLVLFQPVKRILKYAILGACAPRCTVTMLSFYKSEKPSPRNVQRFMERVSSALARA